MADDRRQLLQEADRAARRGKLAKATEIYRRLALASPRDLSLQQKLADALARSGEDLEAADLFSRLAESYWENGHRSRAIATLKRALRIRKKSAKLLFRLGAWTLEQGHPADARTPLLDAAELECDPQTALEACESYERLARHCSNDPAVHEAHVRVVERAQNEPALARAKAGLAVALVRSGRVEAAADALAGALAADPESMVALEKMPQLIEVVDELDDAARSELAAGDEPATRVAAAVLVAAWHARHARNEEGAEALRTALEEEEGWNARARAHAADALAEVSEHDLAASLVENVFADPDLDRGAAKRATRALHKILSESPGHSAAAGLLAGLSGALDADPIETSIDDADEALGEPSEEAPIAAPASLDETGPVATPDLPLPANQMQVVIEAKALFEHGLVRRARASLDALEERWRDHADVRALEALWSGAPAGGPATGPAPATPAEAALPSVPSAVDDDLFVLTEDDETGALHAQEPPQGPAASTAEGAGPGQEDEIGQAITEVLAVEPVEDDETRYEMAVGLIQMGLEGQAVELLRECVKRPARRGESALELLRIHTHNGDLDEALSIGSEVLEAPDLTLTLRTELLAEVAAVAFHQGRDGVARDAIDELTALAPDHPSLEGLKARVAATDN